MKHKLLRVFTFSLMFVMTLAHADFRRAVDAYISRDAETLLKEVQSSVKNKNNEGLLLFLHAIRIDASTSSKSNLYEGYKDRRTTLTTLETILNTSQQKELEDNLSIIVKSSDIETQYLYAINVQPILRKSSYVERRKINDTFIQKGSYVANFFNSNLASKSEAGDPFSQLQLGLKYLNFTDMSGYGCQQKNKDPICEYKDELKGYRLLKQALKTYDGRGHDALGIYADVICELFQATADGNKKQLEQATLWCLTALNAGSQRSLKKLKDLPTKDIPQDYKKTNNPLPQWLSEIRKQSSNDNLPIFSYFTNDYMDFELDVYSNGEVRVGFGDVSKSYPGDYLENINFIDIRKDLWIKVSPERVSEFLIEFKRLIASWDLYSSTSLGLCDSPDLSQCIPKRYQATFRGKSEERHFYLEGLVWHIAKLQGSKNESETTTKIGEISALVERFFPTSSLRCGLSNSLDFKQACIDRDSRWNNLTKEGNRHGNSH